MKTLNQIKKEIREKFEMIGSWNVGGDTSDENYFNEVVKAFAKEACAEQRLICADAPQKGEDWEHNIESIKQAEEPTLIP